MTTQREAVRLGMPSASSSASYSPDLHRRPLPVTSYGR